MIRVLRVLFVVGLAASVSACGAFLDKGNAALDAYFSAKGKVETKVVEGATLSARVYCQRNSPTERVAKRQQFAAVADSRPETAGMRVEVTCPGDLPQ